jgi:hypothetical protein
VAKYGPKKDPKKIKMTLKALGPFCLALDKCRDIFSNYSTELKKKRGGR